MPAPARWNATIETILLGSGTTASDTSIASSVPTASIAALIPEGAACLTRSSRPGPYVTTTAPTSRSSGWFRSLAVATTVAPAASDSCTASRPTAPDPAWTSTVSPELTLTTATACTAVAPTSNRPDACSQDSSVGLGTTPFADTVTAVA